MLTICYLVERTNPDRDLPVRKQQIKREILEAVPAVFTSTSVSLLVLNYLYPLRWGFPAPVFPSSLSSFALEFVYWMACFEVNSYYLHRMLHLRKPVDIYRLVHRDHHLFFFPTAFASQSITPVEAVLFALCAFGAALFLLPISVATQYICGLLLLSWSIFAHDSRFVLDHGAHYEHHNHPDTNFGFLGVMDVLHQTVWWGHAYDDHGKRPKYVHRMGQLHQWWFGEPPKQTKDGHEAMVSDFSEEDRAALKQQQQRRMNKNRTD